VFLATDGGGLARCAKQSAHALFGPLRSIGLRPVATLRGRRLELETRVIGCALCAVAGEECTAGDLRSDFGGRNFQPPIYAAERSETDSSYELSAAVKLTAWISRGPADTRLG
jgi:hypothetical protein